jgi:hypothetical protein
VVAPSVPASVPDVGLPQPVKPNARLPSISDHDSVETFMESSLIWLGDIALAAWQGFAFAIVDGTRVRNRKFRVRNAPVSALTTFEPLLLKGIDPGGPSARRGADELAAGRSDTSAALNTSART